MAVYENKFEIGDEVFTKDNEHEYPLLKRRKLNSRGWQTDKDVI